MYSSIHVLQVKDSLAIDQLIPSMIRVNQAGEYGAKCIYEGQLAVLGKSPSAPLLQHMKEQELSHLKSFNELLVKHRVRPTLLQPLWYVAGYALGAATGLLGERAAMACTVAIEEVIDEHYESQLHTLGTSAPELSELIYTCQQEELEHRDMASQKSAPYPLMSQAIKTASRFAIWCSTRI